MKGIRVRLTFTEEVLGTLPGDKEVYSKFIASKAPDAATMEEELEMLSPNEYAEKQMTVFARNEKGEPCIYDYQIRGFFKEACGILKKVPGKASNGITANKKLIDNYVFIKERMIPLNLQDKALGVCERPLRAQTMQGERIALAMSEAAPAGTTCEFTVQLLLETSEPKKGKKDVDYVLALKEWLDYGAFKGYGQWRNSSKGRFSYEIL